MHVFFLPCVCEEELGIQLSWTSIEIALSGFGCALFAVRAFILTAGFHMEWGGGYHARAPLTILLPCV